MRAEPRLPRQSVGEADDRRSGGWTRAKVLPLGVALVTLALLVAFGLPVNANNNGWAGSGKRVGYGSSKSAKAVRHPISAGRIASAAPVVGAADNATTVTANIPTTTVAPATTAAKPSTTGVTTTRPAVVAAPPATPVPTAPPRRHQHHHRLPGRFVARSVRREVDKHCSIKWTATRDLPAPLVPDKPARHTPSRLRPITALDRFVKDCKRVTAGSCSARPHSPSAKNE